MYNIRTIMHAETQRGNQKPYIEGQTIQWPKDRPCNGQKKKDKRTMIYKTLHRKLKLEQYEPH
jgi:hypothetical protein